MRECVSEEEREDECVGALVRECVSAETTGALVRECVSADVERARLADVQRQQSQSPSLTREEAQMADILRRLPAFRNTLEPDRFRELLQDYPDECSVLEFKKFVEYWRSRTLTRPWVALRNWLDHERHAARLRRVPPSPWRRQAVPHITRQLPTKYTEPPDYGDLPPGLDD